MAHEFLHSLAGRREILAGIELLGLGHQDLADRGGHGQTQIGVDVDLGATHTASHLDVRLGHAGRLFAEVAAVLVDLLGEVLRNGGGSVQHQRVVTHTGFEQRLLNGLEALEVQMLFTLELVGTVAVADGNGQRVHAGQLDELNGFIGVGVSPALGVATALFTVVVLSADEHAEFALDHAIMLVGVLNDLSADLNILFERIMRGVDHHAGETLVDALLAQFEAVTVIQMDRDGDGGQLDRGVDQPLEVHRMGVIAGSLGDLQHHWGLLFLAGLNDGLEQLHVVHVESTEGVFALQGLREQFARVGQWHKSKCVADRFVRTE